ncbi:hypothetical protein [Streptomyces sp. NBC_00401]|uniref:hypothetical protein n=1 Tax=unclassified Streptomyces TaxID=2593676 RepID=UPI0022537657|nr:hypothetical protein [Streptomyces sp. NBC_00401]MCX5085437.1 hypothetical protein [Streptomyces sp. NBC_00401]
MDAARSIDYFSGNGADGPLWTLAVWAAGGAAVALLCGVLASRARAPAERAHRHA